MPELFREYKVPIFIVRYIYPWDAPENTDCQRHAGNYIILNGELKPHNFVRVFDPYAAFQEISMYLGGVLGTNNPPIPHVSDEDLSAAKGFDKWSFRKEPKS